MSSAELDNLVKAGKLKREPPAAHARALFALRRMGYRSESRYLVFQALPHTAGLPAATWRVLAKAHERRNEIEYGGAAEQDERLLAGLIEAARGLREVVAKIDLDI